jgi:hypothetical protein
MRLPLFLFAAYLLLPVAGVLLYIAVGLTHN